MDDTKIEKRAGVRATSDRLWDLVSDLSRWGEWNPYEREPVGRIGFGAALTLIESYPDLGERRATARVADWLSQ